MQPILIYSERTSPRLQYVLNWLFNEQLKTGYRLIHNEAEVVTGTISYGCSLAGALSIPDAGLMWQSGIEEQNTILGNWDPLPVIFSTEQVFDLPFDIFSAIFFLLSRYEEHYPYIPDKYGRYPATASMLYKNGLLRRPVIDEWITRFGKLLAENFGHNIPASQFSFLPTYDIDIAWSYKHKGFTRNASGFARDLLAGKFRLAGERINVLSGTKPDPYDSFAFLWEMHHDNISKPVFFILAALHNTAYDKNILPSKPSMKQLLRQLADYGEIGLHPSFFTDKDPQAWIAEKKTLEKTSGRIITASRQHYIKMSLPETYHFLLQHGITDDYSMGYGTHLGFRAGTGRSFPWYNINAEQTEALTIHPFCFMDTTAHYEEQMGLNDALGALEKMTSVLKETNSKLVTIFHNFSLGTANEWRGWNEKYSGFVQRNM